MNREQGTENRDQGAGSNKLNTQIRGYFISISEISSIILPKNTDTKNFINILIDNHKIK